MPFLGSQWLPNFAERRAMEGTAGGLTRDGSLSMSEISRLRWQCRRGLKELDLVLEKYLREDYSSASSAEQRAFTALLDLPDPLLLAYVMGRDQPATPEQLHVVESLRRAP